MKTDLETLRKEYPQHLRENRVKTDHVKFLSKYVLENGKSYKRSDMLNRMLELHAQLGGNSFNETAEVVGHAVKKHLSSSSDFESDPNFRGRWLYKGESSIDSELTKTSGSIQSSDEPSESFEDEIEALERINASVSGKETLYVWWHPDSEKLAKHEQRSEWAMKIGRHHQPSVKNRFDDYKVAVPHTPTVGLLVACEKASVLERTVHSTLTNRGKRIGEMGTEWYTTSVAEVKEILRFNSLV